MPWVGGEKQEKEKGTYTGQCHVNHVHPMRSFVFSFHYSLSTGHVPQWWLQLTEIVTKAQLYGKGSRRSRRWTNSVLEKSSSQLNNLTYMINTLLLNSYLQLICRHTFDGGEIQPQLPLLHQLLIKLNSNSSIDNEMRCCAGAAAASGVLCWLRQHWMETSRRVGWVAMVSKLGAYAVFVIKRQQWESCQN